MFSTHQVRAASPSSSYASQALLTSTHEAAKLIRFSYNILALHDVSDRRL